MAFEKIWFESPLKVDKITVPLDWEFHQGIKFTAAVSTRERCYSELNKLLSREEGALSVKMEVNSVCQQSFFTSSVVMAKRCYQMVLLRLLIVAIVFCEMIRLYFSKLYLPQHPPISF